MFELDTKNGCGDIVRVDKGDGQTWMGLSFPGELLYT